MCRRNLKSDGRSRASAFRIFIAPSILVGLIGISSFSGCTDGDQEAFILQREWYPNSEYIGDVYAEQISEQGGRKVRIALRSGGEIIDPIAEVRTGRVHMGVASADRVLLENAKGGGLVVLAAATSKSPVTFAYKPDNGVDSPKDFEGKTVGIQKGTNTELVLDALLKTNEVDVEKISILESGWDTVAFEADQIDVQGVFAYDEPLTLKRKGVKVEQLRPIDHKVDFIGTVYFTSRDLLEERSKDIQLVMNSLVQGWQLALSASSNDAAKVLKKRFPGVDEMEAAESFEIGKEYFIGDRWNDQRKPLYASKERWETMAQTLIELEKLDNFVFSDNVDYSYLDIAASGISQ